MLVGVQKFIPVLSSEAGLCLTPDNWKKANVTSVSYSLEFLLHKPGLELLKKITDLSQYLGWTGTLVLNAASLIANKEGDYLLKSPYDGSQMKLTSLDLIQLIMHLKPDAVILPKKIIQNCANLWEYWNDYTVPFLYPDDLCQQPIMKEHGVYLDHFMLDQLDKWSHVPRYIMGVIDREQIKDLILKELVFIETDEPATAAVHGRVYSQVGEIDLTLRDIALCFETIDPDCGCSTCSQQLTQAYLHHLLQHTPLLCKRFLIEHNIFWINNSVNRTMI